MKYNYVASTVTAKGSSATSIFRTPRTPQNTIPTNRSRSSSPCESCPGVFKWPSGKKFCGQWQEGRQHGRGLMTMADGKLVTAQRHPKAPNW
eukprot:4387961-Amphidinium_carterae.2